MSDVRLSHMRLPEVVEQQWEVALFPVGSTEPHAFHLSYGTDTVSVSRISRRAVKAANEQGAKVLLLPTLPISCNENVWQCPWAMGVRPRTLMDIVGDVVRTCQRNGLRKLVVLNGHGGNTSVLQAALRELAANREVFVAMTEWWSLSHSIEKELMESEERGHACEMETSIMLSVAPEFVDMEAAEPTKGRKTVFSDGTLTFPPYWNIYTRNTGLGDPTKATPEKGDRMVEVAVERLARTLKELNDAPMDGLFPYQE